ncbi:MAG: serine/threonine-protein kinase [Candidatus Nanopelagicales bacterium]
MDDRFCGGCGAAVATPTPAEVAHRPVESLRPEDPAFVGDYRLAARLGSGGMGTVYLGYDPDNEPVAVKVVQTSISEQREFRQRFAREVSAMRLVKSPNVVELIAANEGTESQWISMEYVDGPNLAERVTELGPLPAEEVRVFATSLAEGISAIHLVGLVHRDLKPSNVMLSKCGPKILDFGIARAMDATSLTTSGQVVGSIGWLAPEQVQGTSAGTKATDIHAWGALVYYAATGKSPYGVGRSDVIAWRILNTTPDTSELPRELADLRATVNQALAQLPRDRPSATDLLNWANPKPMDAHTRVGRVNDMDTAVLGTRLAASGTKPGIPSGAAPNSWFVRNRTAAIAAATIILILLGMGGYGIGHSQKSQDPAMAATPSSTPPPSPAASPTGNVAASDGDSTYYFLKGDASNWYAMAMQISGNSVLVQTSAGPEANDAGGCFEGQLVGNSIDGVMVGNYGFAHSIDITKTGSQIQLGGEYSDLKQTTEEQVRSVVALAGQDQLDPTKCIGVVTRARNEGSIVTNR